MNLYGLMLLVTASLVQSGEVHLKCTIERSDVEYYGQRGALKATAPTHHSSTVEYVVDYGVPTIKVESNSGSAVFRQSPSTGSTIEVGSNGISMKRTIGLLGGFEMRDELHFDADGMHGRGKSDVFSRGELVSQRTKELTCSRHR